MVAEQLDPVAVLLFCASESWGLLALGLIPVIGLLSTVSVGRIQRWRAQRRRSVEAEERWRKLVRKLHRIRRLQRYFAHIGIHLRDNFPKRLKDELKRD